MLSLLWISLLTAHLLAAHLSATLPLFAAWVDLRGLARDQGAMAGCASRLVWGAMAGLACASAVGGLLLVIPIHFGGATPWHRVFQLPRAAVLMLIEEFVFSVVLLGMAAWLWGRDHPSRANFIVRRLLAVLAATNLLYHFPLFFSAVATWAWSPNALPLDGNAWRATRLSNPVLLLTAHHWLAAVATGGVAVVWWSARAPSPCSDPLSRAGCISALVASLIQVPVGIALAAALPQAQQQLLLGGDYLATGLFLASLTLALYLLQQLAHCCFQKAGPRESSRLAATFGSVIALMTATLHVLRTAG